MGIFGKKAASARPYVATRFDGVSGAAQLEQLVDDFLRYCAVHNDEAALNTAQAMFSATPSDPNARTVGPDFLIRPWNWISAVARHAESGTPELAAKIGLMCQIWNRMILRQEPRYQLGRLVAAPIDVELAIYKSAVTALLRLPTTRILVPDGDGWSVGEALEQISHCVRLLVDQGVAVDAELRGLASY